ncbi:periplasmic heavy metal sensor [Solidesulfovibrio sp.]|uniref:periplasmic heavy metal sensor n=1 Tax=Solidesulfovibrio sp. TaxID=2910990 RepID=UPI00260252F7|nr:periplasmic heavy metal sensor [Solidesulfovibrio sp.]
MKTRTRLVSLALALAALLGLAGLANAQMPGHGMTHGYAGVALTPEKQAAVHKAYADFDAATASLRQQLAAKQYELEAQIVAASPDDKKVQSLTREIADLNAKCITAQVALQGQLAKLGLPAGSMGCGMVGAGMMNGNMMDGTGVHHSL